MAKAPKTLYTCTECGGTTPKWVGKCPHCGEWNTLQESLAAPEPKNARFQSWAADSAQVVDLSQVSAVEVPREATGMGELDRVLGGGLVDGAVILLGGDPGRHGELSSLTRRPRPQAIRPRHPSESRTSGTILCPSA